MSALIFIVFAAALVLGMPIAMSMVLSTVIPRLLGTTMGSSVNQLITNSFSGADTTPIIAVPLFILAGVIMAEGGISRKLFNVFA